MRIVKVNAIASTNSYLKDYSRAMALEEDVLLYTEVQRQGRGQRGAFWESEPYSNLTFSIYKRLDGFKADRQFYITMAVSLAVYDLLDSLGVKRLSIKWPNDILAGSRKICGILIESVVKKGAVDAVIIGVGLNVNQTVFDHAPRATSVQLETGKEHDLHNLLKSVPPLIDRHFAPVINGDLGELKSDYKHLLFKRGVPSLFRDCFGKTFMAIIEGVSPQGLLLLKREDDTISTHDLKEVKLLY